MAEDSLQVDKESEVNTTCSPCLEAGKTTEANRYCVDCKSFVCDQCLQDHNKFAALRKHHIVDKSEAAEYLEETEQSKGNIRIECGSHYGQYTDRYCKIDDEVCCNVCMTIKHRSCKQTEMILTVAEGIRESKEFSDTKESLEQFLVFANQEKADRNENLTNLDEKKTQILSDIDEFEENIRERIRVIAETSREKIRVAHAKHVNAVKSDVTALDTVMSGLKESLNKLNKREVNEFEAFVSTKNCQKTLSEVNVVVKDLSDKWLQTELYYKFNTTIIQENLTEFGDVIEEKKTDPACRLPCKRNVNIRIQTDINPCRINGICQLADGTFVTIDSKNANIKRLTDKLEVAHTINLDDPPESICATGSNEVAITVPGKNQIQFVKVNERLSLGPSFSTAPGRCTVITYDAREDKLYVCCKNVINETTNIKTMFHRQERYSTTISVYNKKGTLLTTCEKGIARRTVLFEPYKILLETDVIQVLDTNQEIVVFKKTDDGQLTHTREQRGHLLSISPSTCNCLCLLSKDVMLSKQKLYRYGSGACQDMCLTSMDGRTIKTLEMELSSPVLAAIFNKLKSTMIVTGESCEIREYKVPQKIMKLLK